MKVFPIKVEKFVKDNYKIVEWMLGNTCNYNCSFCGPDYKSGSKKYLDLALYTSTIDKIISETNSKIWFKLTGGEPTLYPKLIELATFIKQTGNLVYIISNGSRTIRWWSELKESNSIDMIALTFHPEQTDNYEHIINIVNLFKDTSTLVTVNITVIPKYFDVAVNAFDQIKARCKTIVNLQQINDNAKMKKYSESQKITLIKKSMANTLDKTKKYNYYPTGVLTFTYNDGVTVTDQAINFIKKEKNNFYNYLCDAGKDFIRIQHDTVQRAICGVGKKHSIYNELLFYQDSVICDKTVCDCTLDLIQTKKINS